MHAGAAALEHCRFTGAFTELSISADFPWLTPMAEDEALLASRLVRRVQDLCCSACRCLVR